MLFGGMLSVACLETVALGMVAFFASAVTDPANVLASKYVLGIRQMIDAGFLNSARGLIIGTGLIMLVFILIKNCLKAVFNYWIARYSGAIEAYFGKMLLEGFLNMPYQWHLVQNSADLINAVQWRVYMGRNFIQPCLTLFNDVLMVVIMVTALFIVQPMVSLFVIVVLGGSACFIYTVIKQRIDKVSVIARNYQIHINKETTMAIQGIKDVKISGKETVFALKFLEKANPLARLLGVQKTYGESPVLILETVGFGMLFLSIFVMLMKFDITTAYMTATMALLAVTAWKTLPAVSQILGSLSRIRSSLPHIQTLMDYIILIETNTADGRQKKETSFRFNHHIQFKNVSFAYQTNEPEILRDLNFSINKGETIGIIGVSGAGKSTLVDLLIGLLTPVKGNVFIDGQCVHDHKNSWLEITGYVPQSPYIYDTTLAQNIAFGENPEKADREWIKQCCTMASMDDFVYQLSDGIDTFIGERGIKLSGGQQQRVAIARALYKKPEVLIFDEATSSLDTKSEQSIQNTIYSFKGKQTLIIIAHRLSTVEACDKVVWLENGRIKMTGSPEQIIKAYQDTLHV